MCVGVRLYSDMKLFSTPTLHTEKGFEIENLNFR